MKKGELEEKVKKLKEQDKKVEYERQLRENVLCRAYLEQQRIQCKIDEKTHNERLLDLMIRELKFNNTGFLDALKAYESQLSMVTTKERETFVRMLADLSKKCASSEDSTLECRCTRTTVDGDIVVCLDCGLVLGESWANDDGDYLSYKIKFRV